MNYYYSINGIVGACPLGNQVKPEPMSQRPAAFEMQPATPRPCYSPCTSRPFVHLPAPSIHPIDTLLRLLYTCQGPRTFGIQHRITASAQPDASQPAQRILIYRYPFTAACSQHCGIISLQPKSKPSHLTLHGRVLLHSSPTPTPRQRSISATAH